MFLEDVPVSERWELFGLGFGLFGVAVAFAVFGALGFGAGGGRASGWGGSGCFGWSGRS